MQAITGRQGLLCLVGEGGTGKTLLLRDLREDPPPDVRPVELLQPRLAFEELVEFVARRLGRPADTLSATALPALQRAVAAEAEAGHNVLLLVDEAQALPSATLAALPELLTPLARPGASAMQILLAGQPPLLTALAVAGLRGRVAVTTQLRPLARNDVAGYIHDHLARAGATRELFTPGALTTVALVTRGVPRLVNVIAAASLLGAFRDGARAVTEQHVRTAWKSHALLESAPTPATLRQKMPPAPEASGPSPDENPFARPTRPSAPRVRRPARALVLSGVLAAVFLGIVVARNAPWWHQTGAAKRPPPVAAAPPRQTPREPLPTPGEALDIVDAFRRMYEARDAAAVEGLLAFDATEGGAARLAAVAPDVPALAQLAEVAYLQPAAQVEPHGTAMEVRAPFVIRYRDLTGRTGVARGTAVWQVARRDGAPRIVGLARALAPGPTLPDDRR